MFIRYKKKKRPVNIIKARWLMKTKHVSTSKLIKKLDRIYSRYIRLDALTGSGYIQCYTCGGFFTLRQIDCGHYISRERQATRYEERNTKPQCHSCNRIHEGRKDVFAMKLVEQYGSDILKSLNAQANFGKHWTAVELQDKINDYSYRNKALTQLKAGML